MVTGSASCTVGWNPDGAVMLATPSGGKRGPVPQEHVGVDDRRLDAVGERLTLIGRQLGTEIRDDRVPAREHDVATPHRARLAAVHVGDADVAGGARVRRRGARGRLGCSTGCGPAIRLRSSRAVVDARRDDVFLGGARHGLRQQRRAPAAARSSRCRRGSEWIVRLRRRAPGSRGRAPRRARRTAPRAASARAAGPGIRGSPSSSRNRPAPRRSSSGTTRWCAPGGTTLRPGAPSRPRARYCW